MNKIVRKKMRICYFPVFIHRKGQKFMLCHNTVSTCFPASKSRHNHSLKCFLTLSVFLSQSEEYNLNSKMQCQTIYRLIMKWVLTAAMRYYVYALNLFHGSSHEYCVPSHSWRFLCKRYPDEFKSISIAMAI